MQKSITSPSAAYNVMRHGKRWMPAFQRGTPKELAEPLATRLRHLWLIAVTTAGFSALDEP